MSAAAASLVWCLVLTSIVRSADHDIPQQIKLSWDASAIFTRKAQGAGVENGLLLATGEIEPLASTPSLSQMLSNDLYSIFYSQFKR